MKVQSVSSAAIWQIAQGWETVRKSENSHTLYRREEGKETHSFKVSSIRCFRLNNELQCIGEIDAPLFHIVAVIYEIDLYPKWFPFMKVWLFLISEAQLHRQSAIEYKAVSRFRKLASLTIGSWPLADREMCVHAYCDQSDQAACCMQDDWRIWCRFQRRQQSDCQLSLDRLLASHGLATACKRSRELIHVLRFSTLVKQESCALSCTTAASWWSLSHASGALTSYLFCEIWQVWQMSLVVHGERGSQDGLPELDHKRRVLPACWHDSFGQQFYVNSHFLLYNINSW